MDTSTASVIVATIMGVTSITVAVVQARTSGERLTREAYIGRLQGRLVKTYGEDPDDVKAL